MSTLLPRRLRASVSGLLLALAACGRQGAQPPAAPVVERFPNPAPAGSGQAGLTVGPSGTVALSWQSRDADSALVLGYATLAGDRWSEARAVVTGPNQLASALDVPGVAEVAPGRLVAIWRGKHAPIGYDVVLASSTDSGRTWSQPSSPHRDSTATEHGFVSWVGLGDSIGIVWVDGRGNADSSRVTRLAYAGFGSSLEPLPERSIEPKICDCCHTGSARVPGGAVVVYRDRREGEIRDISAIRWIGGAWREPVSVHDDGWHIRACPVNGPAVAARGAEVAVAWYTMAHDTARVRVAFSADTAATFSPPIEINDGVADGRVGIALVGDGDAIVSWVERRDGKALLRIRRVLRDGARSVPVDVAEFGDGRRAGGMPRLVETTGGRAAVLAWTDPATGRVATARLSLPGAAP